MAFRLINDNKTLVEGWSLLVGALGCYDTLGADDCSWGRDAALHERSAYEMVRDQLTPDQQAELDQVDEFWRANAAAFNKDFGTFHVREDRAAALEGYVEDDQGETPPIPRSHWWWRPIEGGSG